MQGTRPFTREEEEKIVEYFHTRRSGEDLNAHRNNLMLHTGIYAGFRIAEVLSLKVGDFIAFTCHGVFAPKEYIEVRKKNTKGKSRGRVVPVHDRLKAAIEEYLTKELALGHLKTDDVKTSLARFAFYSSYHKDGSVPVSYRNCNYVFHDFKDHLELGGNISTHSMRKTLARRVYDNSGKDLMLVKDALGHANITSTQNYLGLSDGELKNAFLTT